MQFTQTSANPADNFQQSVEDARASHLVHLDGEPWALWRQVCLRGAGFPAALLLKLASPAAALACDRLLQLEIETELAYKGAQAALLRDIERVADEGQAALRKVLWRLKKGKPMGALAAEASEGAAAIRSWQNAQSLLPAAREEFQRAFDDSVAEASRTLTEIARLKTFREAVIWQNRQAIHGSIEAYLKMDADAASQKASRRKRELLIVNYLQRYCAKNDTIGFFGPVGWANFARHGESINVRPGPRLIEARSVYFEGWCLDVLAETLSADKALRPWIAPRRLPFVRLEGDMLYQPFERPVKLPPMMAVVLQACDGEKTAHQVALELAESRASGIKSVTDVYRFLEILRGKGVISWTLEVPWTLEMPEQRRLEENLRARLKLIGDDELRGRAEGALAELESARDAVAAAAGDDEKLDQALAQLDETFTRLTGSSSTRGAGQTYAGRTLVYEDCRRDIGVEFGPQVLQALGEPLSLLLLSARWFTSEVAALYRAAFREIYRELATASNAAAVDAVGFWLRAQPLLFEEGARLVDKLVPAFQQRWAQILSLPAGERRVQLSAHSLRNQVLEAFNSQRPGWAYARYHSPDVMIAARGAEAIARGDFQLVLGELHLGLNTLGGFVFMAQHPAPEEAFRALDQDIPETRVVPVTPKAMVTSRNYPVFISEKDFRLEFARDPSSVPRARALQIGEMLVEEAESGLIVRTRDGSRRFDIIDAFADSLSGLATNSFKLLRPQSHTPRITIDRLIISRETWRFAPAEIEFAYEKQDAERFVAARRWARRHGLPRFVFVKTPVEVKPCYIDFDSHSFIDLCARMVRASEAAGSPPLSIAITEMVPDLGQLWLPDAEGQRYTSELRIVAVDQAL